MKSPFWKKYMSRISGPTLSVLAHIAIILLLINSVGFVAKTKQAAIQVEMSQATDLELDEILPVETPPEEIDTVIDGQMGSDEALSTADFSVSAPSTDMDSGTVADDSFNVLDNLSPLKIQGVVGADLSSQGALTSKYGKRAVENGLLGSYFNRVDFTGETFMRIDTTLNYEWGTNSPWQGKIKPEFFSIIWTGRLVPPRTGIYTLYLSSDDGARLWIDGELVLDQYTEHVNTTFEVKKEMLVGKSYDIKYAFCEATIDAVSKLEWSCDEAGVPRQLIPSEYMWADGKSTTQMLAWNEETRPGQYGNRKLMRNPAMIEGRPFSHLVDYEALDEGKIKRLQLEDQLAEFLSFKSSGRVPASAELPALPAKLNTQQAEPATKDDEVKITIM